MVGTAQGHSPPPGYPPYAVYPYPPEPEFGENFFKWVSRLSQLVVVGGAILFGACLVTPETFANILTDYKARLETRRKDKILSTLSQVKLFLQDPYEEETQNLANTRVTVVAPPDEGIPSPSTAERKDTKLDTLALLDGILEPDTMVQHIGQGEMYHHEITDDIERIVNEAPIRRYGVLMGGRGSGKTQLLRRIAHGKPYVAFVSFNLVSSTNSLVDAIAEEVGFDFEDWTERLLQSYLFRTQVREVMTPLDKLAFLLDEIEEACQKLKFDPENKHTKHRALLIFDDVNKFDVSDPTSRKALTMLFNAASKWAREDTALIFFTVSNKMFAQEYGKLIKRDVLGNCKVYSVNQLAPREAAHFLHKTINPPPTPSELNHIISSLGTRINDLRHIAEERAQGEMTIQELVEQEIKLCTEEVRHLLSALEYTSPQQRETLGQFLDIIAREGRTTREKARSMGVLDLVEDLVEEDVIGCRGLAGLEFGSRRIAEAWKRLREKERSERWWKFW
ncbi:hypothetical protein HK104_008946 [Borealophlyctis nickersoniae]|nr:hypothetical protein HK104_008946 [Borealophlyctis nickersoniae]